MNYKGIQVPELEQRTPEWHEFRSKGIGGSEAAYVMNVAYRGNIKDLWEQKVGIAPEFVPNAAMERGTRLEPEARLEFSLPTGLDVKPMCVIHPEFSFVRSSLDGISHDGRIIVEIKCPGFVSHER